LARARILGLAATTTAAHLQMLQASPIQEAEMSSTHLHNRSRVIPFRLLPRSARLVACSVCLRVWENGAWIEAGEAIRQLRTFEHDSVVRLGGALCDRCETELRLRRQSAPEELAA
jgi:hypothetical protein